MKTVSAGNFYMDDDYNLIDEQPRHEVYLNEFLVDEKEISIKIWDSVRSWALLNGYDFSEGQNFPLMGYTLNQDSSVDYPMNMVNWFDCVKWCNARSEFMGRKPVYYSSSDLKEFRNMILFGLMSRLRDLRMR